MLVGTFRACRDVPWNVPTSMGRSSGVSSHKASMSGRSYPHGSLLLPWVVVTLMGHEKYKKPRMPLA